MPKIPNWSLETQRNVSDIPHLSGIVSEWAHDETGDTVAIKVDKEDDFYGIEVNGETDESRDTLQEARELATWLMRENPEGIDWK